MQNKEVNLLYFMLLKKEFSELVRFSLCIRGIEANLIKVSTQLWRKCPKNVAFFGIELEKLEKKKLIY